MESAASEPLPIPELGGDRTGDTGALRHLPPPTEREVPKGYIDNGSIDVNEDLLVRALEDTTVLEEWSDDELTEVLEMLESLKARVWSRLLQLSVAGEEEEGSSEPEPDQLLDVDDTAAVLGVTTRWLYDHADQLPFTRKLAPRTLRFSERGLYRWLGTR